MRYKFHLFIALIVLGLFTTSCGKTITLQQKQEKDSADSQQGDPNLDTGYYDSYEDWRGPGWYYGVWFDSSYGYHNWRRRYYGRRGRRDHGRHYRRRGHRQRHGGHRGHHRGRGRGRGGGRRGR